MMAKHALWTVALMWAGVATAVQAQQRDLYELDSIANSVFAVNSMGARAAVAPLKMSLKSSDVLGNPSLVSNEAFYIYNSTGTEGRFVIVSGDRRMPDVLGYSDNGNFDSDNMPDGLKWFLQKCEAEASLIAQNPAWTRVASAQDSVKTYPVVEPLLGGRAWGQDAPFNWQCPTMGGGHAKTGCVATALAQIMAYHRWPATYDWDKMLDSYDKGYTQEQADEVARLMHDIGEACGMYYGVSVSLASDFKLESALLSAQFDYDDDMRFVKKDYCSGEAWQEMIVEELQERRPVFYDGTDKYGMNGHAFVLDGLDSQGYYHVNWGRSGSYNGYYLLESLGYEYVNEYGVTVKKDYSFNSDAFIHISPNDSIAERNPTNIVAEKIESKNNWRNTFSKNDVIKLGVRTFTNMRHVPFQGECQVLLASENDTLIALLGKPRACNTQLPIQLSYKNVINIEGKLPADLPDGTYRIYAGVRQKGYDEWGVVTGKVEDGTGRGNNYFELVLEGDNFYLSPNDIKVPTAEKLHWITLQQQKESLQFTPYVPLSEWAVISTNGSVLAQGKDAGEGECIRVQSLPAGICLLRGMGEGGQLYVTKFVMR